jgi:iron-sulfur cluster repair protein YtfE (RIC family)
MIESVNHPKHYGGGDNIYEAIKVIEAWDLDFCLGNTLKYISRAGKKDTTKELEDLNKALWYLQRRIQQISK